ncbi:MAG: hypothetical protein KDK39_12680 [Leptospiraceae bacterium]|nr:hypothetical protein [Leptospiraceae bacterium]
MGFKRLAARLLVFIAILLLLVSTVACVADEGLDTTDEDFGLFVTVVAVNAILPCLVPHAIDLGGGYAFSRYCISNRLQAGLIYNHANGLPVSTETLVNGTQLECRGLNGSINSGNAWFKLSTLSPQPGYLVSFIEKQAINRDDAGNPVSYQPFSNYVTGDVLLCTPSNSNDNSGTYQMVKIL